MEGGDPKEEGNAITNRFSAGCTRGFRAMLSLENYVRNSSGLEPSLLELVRMRASQINGYLTVGAARAAEGVSRFFPDIMVSPVGSSTAV
jgi:hypothetical protein